MVHAIRIHQPGGPEVMKWESVEVPAPGPGQVRLKQHGVGVNYIDVYQRSGLYKMPTPLAGSEGAGEEIASTPPSASATAQLTHAVVAPSRSWCRLRRRRRGSARAPYPRIRGRSGPPRCPRR